MKILITGASGFIASNLIPKLLELNFSVVALSKSNVNFNAPNFQYYPIRFNDDNLPENIFKDVDLIIHLACSSVPVTGNAYPDADIQTNFLASIRFFDLAIEKGVKKIIFASSGGVVYGEKNILINENDALNPISSYGITKMLLENHLSFLTRNAKLSLCIIRMANVYGDNFKNKLNQGVINIWAENIKAKKGISLANGNVTRDYIHVLDVVEALILILQKDINGIYNISTGLGHSLEQVLEIFKNNSESIQVIQEEYPRKSDVSMNVLSNEKFVKKSGWNPKISLEEGIKCLLIK